MKYYEEKQKDKQKVFGFELIKHLYNTFADIYGHIGLIDSKNNHIIYFRDNIATVSFKDNENKDVRVRFTIEEFNDMISKILEKHIPF